MPYEWDGIEYDDNNLRFHVHVIEIEWHVTNVTSCSYGTIHAYMYINNSDVKMHCRLEPFFCDFAVAKWRIRQLYIHSSNTLR